MRVVQKPEESLVLPLQSLALLALGAQLGLEALDCRGEVVGAAAARLPWFAAAELGQQSAQVDHLALQPLHERVIHGSLLVPPHEDHHLLRAIGET